MKTLLGALLLAAPLSPALPPAVAALIEPPVACYVDETAITYVVVCVDRHGKRSWIA